MKKQLLTIAIITLTVTSLTFAQNYTDELKSAYDYAYGINITTQSSIDSANMFGSLIRAHMAKMMVNYAQNVLGKTPDYLLPCNFSDIANESTELKWYIVQACQMGLMGVGITKFNPDGVVTRAQFGTVLSRALYGDMYNEGTPYYSYHLQALKQAGVMTNISKPDANEIRWYVMLMMMRASGLVQESSSSNSVCDSQETQLLCLVGSLDCPSECQTTTDTNSAGALRITGTSRDVWSLPSGTKYVGSLELTASDADIKLKTLTFQKVGTLAKVRIEDNGIKIAEVQTTQTENTITMTFSPNVIVVPWTSKILHIFIESNSSDDQWIIISNNKNITSSAVSVWGTFPLRLSK